MREGGDYVNDLLVKARENKRLSRKELAEALEISVSMVAKVENCIRRASPDLACRWAEKLGIKETQLYKYFFDYKPDYKSCKVGENDKLLQSEQTEKQAG